MGRRMVRSGALNLLIRDLRLGRTTGRYRFAPKSIVDNSKSSWDCGWVGQHTKRTEHATNLLVSVEMGARPAMLAVRSCGAASRGANSLPRWCR